jgi:2-(1,2-epoxy-1,2-dihydrophenyl)acetyl-CoA isomerase
MSYSAIGFDVRDGVAHVLLNRPKAANALNLELVGELLDASQRCRDDHEIRAVLLSGAGPMFSAGGDLRAFANAPEGAPAFIQKLASTLHQAVSVLARMDPPVVVAVNGVAAGAGMSIVCHADLAIAAESARFTMAYTAAGLAPDGGSTHFLPRIVGYRRAAELMLTNRRLSAAEALEWNIVNRVVPDTDLMAEAERLALALAGGPTRAFGAVKRLLSAGATNDLEPQLDLETKYIVEMAGTRDGMEGIHAFLEKRAPRFTGE